MMTFQVMMMALKVRKSFSHPPTNVHTQGPAADGSIEASNFCFPTHQWCIYFCEKGGNMMILRILSTNASTQTVLLQYLLTLLDVVLDSWPVEVNAILKYNQMSLQNQVSPLNILKYLLISNSFHYHFWRNRLLILNCSLVLITLIQLIKHH